MIEGPLVIEHFKLVERRDGKRRDRESPLELRQQSRCGRVGGNQNANIEALDIFLNPLQPDVLAFLPTILIGLRNGKEASAKARETEPRGLFASQDVDPHT